MRTNLLPLLALALLLVQCKKRAPDPTKPEDQLPAATQTGAGTFGCLVNGQPWLPSGNNGTPNSVALYDPNTSSYGGAQLNIAAYRGLRNLHKLVLWPNYPFETHLHNWNTYK